MSKSFLETLLAGAKNLTTQQGASDLANQAKGAWNSQNTLTKGAIAGGVLGVLLSGNARRLVGTGVEVGGAALIGGLAVFLVHLALRAFRRWLIGEAAYHPTQRIDVRYVTSESAVDSYRKPDGSTYGAPIFESKLLDVDQRAWDKKCYFFPIMRTEMNKNDQLIQNPGY